MFKVTAIYNKNTWLRQSSIGPLQVFRIATFDLTEEEFIKFDSTISSRRTNYRETIEGTRDFYAPIERFLLNRAPKIVKDLKRKFSHLEKQVDPQFIDTFNDIKESALKAEHKIVVSASTGSAKYYRKDLIIVVEVHPATLLTCENIRLRELGQAMMGKPAKKNPVDVEVGRAVGRRPYSANQDLWNYKKVARIMEIIKKDPYSAQESQNPYIKQMIELMQKDNLL